MKFIDLTGQKIGRLIVISHSINKHDRKNWKCTCECGNITFKTSSSLISGHAKSCGCLNEEWKHRDQTTHGMTKTRFYNIWKGAVYRCTKPNNFLYDRYGGRGIRICDRWLKFENFRDDMYQTYLEHVQKFGEKQTTIDRIDNDKGYLNENCRWATWKRQGNNRKNNKFLKYNGKTMTITEWSKVIGISK